MMLAACGRDLSSKGVSSFTCSHFAPHPNNVYTVVELFTDGGLWLRQPAVFTRGDTVDRTLRQTNKSRGSYGDYDEW